MRDVDNPFAADAYFPRFRSFDWYHGHSWAKGLFDSGDSKDEESSSEDVMFAYALKMWGRSTGNVAVEARGNLMLAVLKRSLACYFLMDSGNVVQPPNLIANKVTGIVSCLCHPCVSEGVLLTAAISCLRIRLTTRRVFLGFLCERSADVT